MNIGHTVVTMSLAEIVRIQNVRYMEMQEQIARNTDVQDLM